MTFLVRHRLGGPRTETVEDLDLSTLDDLDFSPRCRIRAVIVLTPLGLTLPVEPPCGEEGRWILTCRECRTTAWCCDRHLSHVMRVDRICCLECNTVGRGRDVYAFAPLG